MGCCVRCSIRRRAIRKVFVNTIGSDQEPTDVVSYGSLPGVVIPFTMIPSPTTVRILGGPKQMDTEDVRR